MLSYQHSYHAGCFADVVKHAILSRLLMYLRNKDKPLLYLDTHSGRGSYDLQDAHARKTNEAAQGILPIWESRAMLSPLFSPYLNILNDLNSSESLRYYPGSPEIALQLLRDQDRLVFCELHPTEFSHLIQLSTKQKKVYFKKEDGLKCLKASLPSPERRGLVFMDPSYERKEEYQEMIQAIKAAYKRSATMTYCLWYPLINHQLPPQFLKNLASIEANSTLRLEFYMTKKAVSGMTGSGLWIINPPYTLAEEGAKMLKELTSIISPETADYLIDSN